MTATPADFRTVRGREGYDIEEVDRFLDRLADALGHTPPTMTAEQVMGQRFTSVRMRMGYDMLDVDQFLDRAARELRRRHAQAGGVPWELSAAASGHGPGGIGRPGSGSAVASSAAYPGVEEYRSPYPLWVRAAAIVALVALLGLALAQVL